MRSLAKVSLLLIFCSAAFADVAPDPGYTNVPSDLIVEINADLSGYRFFLDSPMRVEEIKITPGTATTVSAQGRAGAAKLGTLIAVPISDMTISGELTPALLENLIRRKAFPKARELFTHYFQTTISVVEKPVWKPPVYRLSLESGVVTSTKISSGSQAGGSLLYYVIPVVAVGVLLTLGIAIIGIWLFRRSRKKGMKYIQAGLVATLLFFVTGFTECYKPVTGTGLPKNIKNIAVPAFKFEATGLRYRVESRFTEAVSREIIRRGSGLKVQGTLEGADAVIEGNIRDFSFSGVLLDREGRARVYEVVITSAVTIRDLRANKILYDNQNFVFRDSFEFSEDPRSFFNEEDPAVERMARAFAESVVSTIVNGLGVKEEKK